MQNFTGTNVCFFGLNRSLSFTVNSIKKYLLDPLEKRGEVSVFGAFCQVNKFTNTRSEEVESTHENGEKNLINFTKVKYIDQGAIDDLIRWDLVFRYGDHYGQINSQDDLQIANSTTKNIFRSMFALKSSFGLIPEVLRNRPTIFVRPDLEILSEFDFDFYSSLISKKSILKGGAKSDGVALLPNWHSWDGLNDRFAICTPGNASITYANRFDSLIPYIELARHSLHPETYLYQIMLASRVEVLPIISTRMSRIRANGKPQDEDFSKGSRSVDLQNETLSALHAIVNKLKQQLQAKAEDLQTLAVELDAQAQEKVDAQQALQDLSQQLSAKAAELEIEKNEKAAGTERFKALEGELASVKDERDAQAQEVELTREESELTLLQLHQVQEKLENVLLGDQAKQKQLEELKQQVSAKAAELETERKERIAKADRAKALEAELASVKDERDAQAQEVELTRKESELSLLQLHQVQEELEQYFLKSRGADQLAAAQQDQLLRAEALMARLLPGAAILASAREVDVEVLPPSPQSNEVQTEALLNSYATSLRRAATLLQRAIRS